MKRLKNQKLATKLAVIIGAMLAVIFAVLIVSVVALTSSTIRQTISSELDQQGKVVGEQVQEVFASATAVGEDMQSYLADVYQNSAAINAAGEENTYLSSVYGVPVKAVPYEMEHYLTNRARNTVRNFPQIVGVGVMFEQDMFAAAIRDYAFFVDGDNVDGALAPFGNYGAYSQEEYYSNAKERKTISVTQPYDYEGAKVVSVSCPILYNDRFMGAIAVDIDISGFRAIEFDTSRYSTLYGLILDDQLRVIYDSRSMDTVGQNLEDLSGAENTGNIRAQQAAGAEFSLSIVRPDGSTATGFFSPIAAGDETWWTLTALDTAEMDGAVRTTVLILVLLSLAALTVLLLVTVLVLRRMLRPIQSVVGAAERISSGNFDLKLESGSGDEIGVLTRTFSHTAQTLQTVIHDITGVLNRVAAKDLNVDTGAAYVGELGEIEASMRHIVSNLNAVMREINQSAAQVATGSDQVAAAAQALSQGATEQASSVEELAATVEDISAQVQETARNAAQARTETANASGAVTDCNRQMQEMTAAIGEISQKSAEIGKIIATIENIAFQTNILALNAAVEAARAGEAGKGFAVVADEVRNLANKSAEASKDTSALIAGSIEAVEKGTRIAGGTAEALAQVVKGAQAVSLLVDKIADAATQQASSIAQVTQGIEQISNVVQTTSATAEESAATSEELSGQAQLLRDLVGGFRLRPEGGPGAAPQAAPGIPAAASRAPGKY